MPYRIILITHIHYYLLCIIYITIVYLVELFILIIHYHYAGNDRLPVCWLCRISLFQKVPARLLRRLACFQKFITCNWLPDPCNLHPYNYTPIFSFIHMFHIICYFFPYRIATLLLRGCRAKRGKKFWICTFQHYRI